MRRVTRGLGILLGMLVLAIPWTGPVSAGDSDLVGGGGCEDHANQTAGLADGETWFDTMVQLHPGTSSADYTRTILTDVGVSESNHPDRHIYTYCVNKDDRNLYTGLWLRLDDDEVERLREITKQRPEELVGFEVTSRVELPSDFYDPPDYSLSSPQYEPPSRSRIGWEAPPTNAAYNRIKVAIADTGVDFTHPDLDVLPGFDCTMEYPTRWQHDYHGHGTAMAGVLGANNNDIGSVGIAAGMPIVPIPVLNRQGWGSGASVACGAVEAYKAGAAGVNFSLGGIHLPGKCGDGSPYVDVFCAVHQAGVTITASAGNSSSDAWNHGPSNIEPVIAVGATSATNMPPGQRCSIGTPPNAYATFSSYGDSLDAVSPTGVCEYTSVPGGRYTTISGTSPAAPGVLGVVMEFKATSPVECWDEPGEAWKHVEAWSKGWMYDENGAPGEGWYGGWMGSIDSMPPSIRFGAPVDLNEYMQRGNFIRECNVWTES